MMLLLQAELSKQCCYYKQRVVQTMLLLQAESCPNNAAIESESCPNELSKLMQAKNYPNYANFAGRVVQTMLLYFVGEELLKDLVYRNGAEFLVHWTS